jgi:hypothetical protein
MQPYQNPSKVNRMVNNAMPVCNKSRYPIQEFFTTPMLADLPDTPEARADRHFHPDLRPLRHDSFPWYIDLPPKSKQKENFGNYSLTRIVNSVIVLLFIFYFLFNIKR